MGNQEHMSDTFFETLCLLAHSSATTTDLHRLMNQVLQISLDRLPLMGMVVWLRSHEQAMLTPGSSRLPAGCSISAIAEDTPVVQRVTSTQHCQILTREQAEPLLLLPPDSALALAPIQSEDALLGLLGYLAPHHTLAAMQRLLQACANMLSAPLLSAWLRRQQAEAEDVADTLFDFTANLREQKNTEDILTTLNDEARERFNSDLAAVYLWSVSDSTNGMFVPVQVQTRMGVQPLNHEPSLLLDDNPILELVISDPDLNALTDLREQPTAIPIYLARHNVRGLVLIPIMYDTTTPLGMFALGYRAPLVPLSRRSTLLAQEMARIVAVALQHTIAPPHDAS